MHTGQSGDSLSSRTPAGLGNSRVAWQAGGILLAALVMGLVYNHSSPLGVRTPEPPDALPSVESPKATHLQPPVTNPPPIASVQPITPAPTPPNPAPSAAQPQFPELKWPAVKALLAAGQIVLIDARLAETYALSRIPGAISLPAYSPVAELQAFAAKFSRDMRFVIYCNSETCDMSHDLAGKLSRQFGFTNLALMPGGFAEYVIAESGGKNPPPP